jgi:hypothetical protein
MGSQEMNGLHAIRIDKRLDTLYATHFAAGHFDRLSEQVTEWWRGNLFWVNQDATRGWLERWSQLGIAEPKREVSIGQILPNSAALESVSDHSRRPKR